MFGWGWEVFTSHGGWWWIPVVCCHVGGVLGVAIYGVVVEHGWGTDTGVGKEEKKMEAVEMTNGNIP